jgi:hypothetical protein
VARSVLGFMRPKGDDRAARVLWHIKINGGREMPPLVTRLYQGSTGDQSVPSASVVDLDGFEDESIEWRELF